MLRRLYDWTLSLAGHRHALWALAAIAFIESSVFPIPPDILIIPMVLAAPTRAWRVAMVATVASVIGGLFGYVIIVAGAGFTPFPYKVITIASGATGLDPTVFIIASVLSRGGRFFLIAALLWRFGVPIRGFLERYLAPLTALFFILLLGGFLVAKAFL
jgi:membrane protein YqaA with SNARE-associated domain